MTTQPADLPRRVTQLREDVDFVYGLIRGIKKTQAKHGKRLDRIEVGQTRLQAKVDGLQSQMGGFQSQMGEHGRRLDRIEERLTHIVELLEARP